MNHSDVIGNFVPRVVAFLGISILAVTLLVAGIFEILGFSEKRDIQEIHRTFLGLSRSQAYERLASMRLEAIAWYSNNSGGGDLGGRWPSKGEVAVDSHYVVRNGDGCGNHAIVVLQFDRNRVSSVGDTVFSSPCL